MMLLWMIVRGLSFFRKNNLTIYIFGSSNLQVFFCKKLQNIWPKSLKCTFGVQNIWAKSLKCTCGVHFIAQLQVVVCIYSKTALPHRYLLGSFKVHLNFIICTYLSFVPSFSSGNTWLALIWFSGNPHCVKSIQIRSFFMQWRHSKLSVEITVFHGSPFVLFLWFWNLVPSSFYSARIKLKFWIICNVCSVGTLMLILIYL